MADERIWPPIARYHFAIDDRTDLDGYRQRGHETILGANRAILIRTRSGARVILDKAGQDGSPRSAPHPPAVAAARKPAGYGLADPFPTGFLAQQAHAFRRRA